MRFTALPGYGLRLTALSPDGISNPVRNVLCLGRGVEARTKRKRRVCKTRRAHFAYPGPLRKSKPDGIFHPVRNVLCFPRHQQRPQNVSSGVTNPAALRGWAGRQGRVFSAVALCPSFHSAEPVHGSALRGLYRRVRSNSQLGIDLRDCCGSFLTASYDPDAD